MTAMTAMTAAAFASAASAVVGSTAGAATISGEKLLELCFVIGSLDLAIFGVLYNTYTHLIQDPPPPPAVVEIVRFCKVLIAVLLVLVGIAGFVLFKDYRSLENWPLWAIAGCFFAMVCTASFISRKLK